jgi:4-amino-4-deoxy-L-arabinose transferase-like glycosyltransferase
MAAALQLPVSPAAQRNARWLKRIPLPLALLIFLLLSLWLASTKAPWCDEGWWVNPAHDLAFHGRMGMNVVEPSGQFINAYLRGIQERTYTYPPNHFVALAGWFRLFGFSAFSARAYSICWSVLALAALFYISRKLFPDPRVAQLAAFLTAIDFIFLWSSADGRPDAMANSLVMCSVAAYLRFRVQSLGTAVFVSQIFAAAGVFAHLNALVVVLALAGVAWSLDRKRLRQRYVFFAAAPYVFFGVLWSVYILQKPADFVAQFLPQAGWSERWRGFLRPDIAVGAEIARHWAAYCLNGLWQGITNGWMVLVPLVYLCALIWFVRARRRLEKTERAFLVFTIVLLCGMTFLNGFKGYFYLIYIVPIYDAVLAAWLLHLWKRSTSGELAASAFAVGFAILQLSASIQHIRADEYHREYEPTIRELEQYHIAGKSIVGTAALGFGLNFHGFKDDIREGTYSGLTPDVLVVDRSYRNFAGLFEKNEPHVFAHVVATLSTSYRLGAQHGSFWIFERVPSAAGSKAGSWIDVAKIETVPKGKRAEYFFRLIFAAGKMHDPL